MKRPFAFYPLFFLHVLLGTSALFGGWVLMTDAEGFGMKSEWLDQSPFKSYVSLGFILFVFNGLFPLFVAAGLLLKPTTWRWAEIFNIYRDRHWAWTYSLFAGLVIIIWIAVQISLVPYIWLQPACIATGLLILIFTLWPDLMKYYQTPEKQ